MDKCKDKKKLICIRNIQELFLYLQFFYKEKLNELMYVFYGVFKCVYDCDEMIKFKEKLIFKEFWIIDN